MLIKCENNEQWVKKKLFCKFAYDSNVSIGLKRKKVIVYVL